ncbi:MAG: hypothetical protein KF725_15660 [Cyclobacteriaceae bacterium]|nr:hypothetical protein [Cyclobacteriaceae bacterium]UYN87774.1 MAG: hypothetical protein KIT51_05840 [Cyclobacteriaceae bacterium]
MANQIHNGFLCGNSYPQIGHALLFESISIAHDGHSIFFIIIRLCFRITLYVDKAETDLMRVSQK